MDEDLLGIEELAEQAGVTRRTVRYYVQRGLIPAPTGTGRGKHYTRAHLDALRQVIAQQRAGVPLAAIQEGSQSEPTSIVAPIQSFLWRRVELEPGLELHVREGARSEIELGRIVEAIRRVLEGA